MAEITNYTSSSITKLMTNLDHYKYNPSAMQQVIFDYLEEITNGEVDIVDPTNPFVFLLEASTVNTSLAITEAFNNLRMQYPSLAQTEEDIYLHMSDTDFINRFSTPSNTDFNIVIMLEELYSKMIYDPIEKCSKCIIPRNTEFVIEDLTFTLSYPIIIKKFLNGIVQITYDASIVNPLVSLTSNIIDYEVMKNTDNTDWLFFTTNLKQFKIDSSYHNLLKSMPFSTDINFDNKFYYARVYSRNNGSEWKEIKVTYTDQVFDNSIPTAVIKLYSNYINVFIPPVYSTTNLLNGEIRIDIFTTNGEITVNLANYKPSSFVLKFSDIDKDININEYTNAFSNMTYYTYSNSVINGGLNGIDFKTLRNRVINNSIGDRNLPITNNQLKAYIENLGFDVTTNVDVLTNRIFLASKKLPKPTEAKLLTSVNLGINTIVLDINDIKTHYNVKNNGERLTILSNTLFINNNGIIKIINEQELTALITLTKTNMVNTINNNSYIYTPYYYLLDSTKSEFEVRAYHLDSPAISDLNFISQNQSIQLPVNTKTYEIIKTISGYKVTIVTKSGNFYKQLMDNLVNVQLSYYPKGENSLAYINGILTGRTDDDERIYEFNIETNHDVDSDNYICVTNGKMFNNENLHTYVKLDSTFNIMYTTSSLTADFYPDEANNLIGGFLLPVNSVVITYEKINIKLGDYLKNLWSRFRSIASGLDYQTYNQNVPMLYDRDVYEIDPVTNSIFSVDGGGNLVYNKIHSIGDPVLDLEGQQVYKYKTGDVVLDENGDPVINNTLSTNKELDLLMVDGRYYFANDTIYKEYRTEFINSISNWVTEDIYNLQNILLEQSKIYFYPKNNLGLFKIYIDNVNTDYVNSEQSFKIDLFVNNRVYNNLDMRTQLTSDTVKILDLYISNQTVNMSDIYVALKQYYSDSVLSFNISGLGGDKDLKIAQIVSNNDRFCLKKKLSLQSNELFIIEEDITIEFHNVEQL